MTINKRTGNWIYPEYDHIKKIDQNDKDFQLFIDKKVKIEPFHYLSVIKMNSTYLEITNRPYNFYGLFSFLFFSLTFIFCVYLPLYMLVYQIITSSENIINISSLVFAFIYTFIAVYGVYKFVFKYLKK